MKFLLEFKYFTIEEELRSIIDTKSSTGKTRTGHLIFDSPESPKAFSSSVLLRKDLSDQEFFDTIQDISGDEFNPTGITNPKKLRKITKVHKNGKRIIQVLNNLKFLKSRERELGKLYCEYCNKGPLKIYDISYNKDMLNKTKRAKFTAFDERDGATCDHRDPVSKGGHPTDPKNLAVSCYSCNQRKSDKSWQEWSNLINIK